MLIFVSLLSLAVSPLLLIKNTLLQFFGALIILIFGLYLSSKYLDQFNFSEYGLIPKRETLIDSLVGSGIGFVTVLLMLFLGEALGLFTISDSTSTFKIEPSLLFAIKMLLVAALEETFYRGYLFTNIYSGLKSQASSDSRPLWVAIMLSSMLFGLAHFNTDNAGILSMLFLAINGIVWCIPFVLTRNLGLLIGLHFTWNFTQTQLGFTMSGNKATHSFYTIQNNGSSLLTGGEYGPEAGIIGVVGFAMMLLLSLIYLRSVRKISLRTNQNQ